MTAPPVFAVALELAVKGFVVLGLTAGAARMLRSSSAAVRHAVWVAGVAGVLVLPAAGPLPWDLRVDPPAVPRSWLHGSGTPDESTPGPDRRMSAALDPRGSETSAPAPDNAGADTQRMRSTPGMNLLESIASSADFELDLRWIPWLLAAVWAAGALVLLIRLGRGAHAANRLAAAARPHPADSGSGVRVLEHPDLAVPMTWGLLRPVILLPEESRDWPGDRLHAVLTHELAHVARWDTLTHTAAAVVRALHWFNPLALVALRSIEDTQELACDDRVLAEGADAPEYAGHLLALARTLSLSSRPAPALGAAPPRRHLEGRLRAMLDERRSRTPVGRTRALALSAVTAAGLVFLAGLGVTRTASGEGLLHGSHGEVNIDGHNYVSKSDGHWTMQHESDHLKLSVELTGRVEFAPDETGVVSMDDGSRFEVRYDAPDGRCEIRLRGKRGGIERRFKLNGDTRDWDAEADAWMVKLLPVVFRHTTFMADKRVARILEESGVDGVLAEIALIDGDYAERVYYGELLTQAELNAGQLKTILLRVAGDVDSDYELAELLVQVNQEAALDEESRRDIIRAAGTIQSDYEQRRVLAAVMEGHELDAEALGAVLKTARALDSDYELSELLTGLAQRYPIPAVAVDDYLEAAATLGSDYEMGRSLKALLENRRLDDEEVVRAVKIGGDRMSSDYELAEFLVAVANGYPLTGKLRTAYRDAARSLQSDYEENRVLGALADAEKTY